MWGMWPCVRVQGQTCLPCRWEGTPHYQGFEKDREHWLLGRFWLLPLALTYTLMSNIIAGACEESRQMQAGNSPLPIKEVLMKVLVLVWH